MLSLLAHAEFPETHVAALVIAVVALTVGFALGRVSARGGARDREPRQ